jgi:hypothetical protein
MGEDER